MADARCLAGWGARRTERAAFAPFAKQASGLEKERTGAPIIKWCQELPFLTRKSGISGRGDRRAPEPQRQPPARDPVDTMQRACILTLAPRIAFG